MVPNTTTHVTLIHRLSSGSDQNAWRDFCSRYELLIRSVSQRYGLVGSDADDVLQDVLLALTKAMPGFEYDPAKGRFRGYLRTVTLHSTYAKLRQKRGSPPLQGAGVSEIPDADARADELWEIEWRQYHMRRAMKTVQSDFAERDLLAFEAYVQLGKSAEDVATDFGLSVQTVYQIKTRVLRRLSAVIAVQVEDEG